MFPNSSDNTVAPPTALISVGHSMLSAGAQYWLVAGAGSTNAQDAWCQSFDATTKNLYSTNGGSTWNPDSQTNVGAFSIQVEPEPAPWFALGLGIAFLCRRKNNHA